MVGGRGASLRGRAGVGATRGGAGARRECGEMGIGGGGGAAAGRREGVVGGVEGRVGLRRRDSMWSGAPGRG
jgi:hypothetical protein